MTAQIWRTCAWPDCPERVDILSYSAAQIAAGPWWQLGGLGYLCPEHGESGHIPNHIVDIKAHTAEPICQCAWSGDSCVSLEDVRAAWQQHVRAVSP